MKFAWIFGLMLIAQQSQVPDDLTLIHEQEPVMTINRSDFAATPMPGVGFPLVDTLKLQTVTDQLDKHIRKEAIDAVIDKRGQLVSEQAWDRIKQSSFQGSILYLFLSKRPFKP